MGTYIDWGILSSYLSRKIDEAEKDNNKSQIKFLRKVYGIMQDFAYIEPKAIKALEEKPKTGHWITQTKSDRRNDYWPTNPRCSVCGGEPYYSNTIYNYKFCPFCGCRMESEV